MYIGKTERNLTARLLKHSDPQKSLISKKSSECEQANFIFILNHTFGNLNDIKNFSGTDKLKIYNLIQANTQTLHNLTRTNSHLLLFFEALYIKY